LREVPTAATRAPLPLPRCGADIPSAVGTLLVWPSYPLGRAATSALAAKARGEVTADMEKEKDRWMAVPAHSLRRRAQAGEPQPPLLLCVLASERKKGLLSGVCSSVRE